jgi:hypothetical protein
MSDQDVPLPPANFEFLVWSMRMQAESGLGVAPWGGENQQVNLPLARHSIDMLGMLQDKTRNNLTLEEQRLLDNTVTELRFRFIQVSDLEQRKVATDATPAGATEQTGGTEPTGATDKDA